MADGVDGEDALVDTLAAADRPLEDGLEELEFILCASPVEDGARADLILDLGPAEAGYRSLAQRLPLLGVLLQEGEPLLALVARGGLPGDQAVDLLAERRRRLLVQIAQRAA